MAVPNTTTFTLEDVCDEIGLIGSARTLSNCFASANSSGFNLLYGNINDNDLLAFRDYDHSGGDPSNTLTVTPSSLPEYSAFGNSQNVSVFSNTTWSVISSPSWINVIGASNTGNDTVTLQATSNGSGEPRSGTVSFRTSSGSPTITRNVSVSQASGFE